MGVISKDGSDGSEGSEGKEGTSDRVAIFELGQQLCLKLSEPEIILDVSKSSVHHPLSVFSF